MTSVRTIFMGSPVFALPTLRLLAVNYLVVGVVTQPDRPSGRGQALTPPPVRVLAQELGIPTIQPRRLREPEAMAQLRQWAPDLIVVAAFGQILKPEVLDLPYYGCINVHASLLPRWRGAAPIQAAILAGDTESGATIMKRVFTTARPLNLKLEIIEGNSGSDKRAYNHSSPTEKKSAAY